MEIEDLFVMVVEPSKVQRKIIVDKLKQAGVGSVAEAETGTETLEIMRGDRPDILVSAYYLDDMNGADLIKAIRVDDELKDVGFILVSSETQFRYLDPVKQSGSTAVLPKPFTDEQLMTALRSALHLLQPVQYSQDDVVDFEGLNVLVVDDSSLARKFIIKVLKGLGIDSFTEAEDGQEAIDILSNNIFDLVVTDYNMPNVNGKELTEYIRQKSGQSSIPIMMVTSEANDGRLSGIQQTGVSALCDKPFSPEEVRQLLNNILHDA